ncbi:hypothetical protein V495_05472 [Pseudogymnoascus sp. VKM F-4514 (FW-929)]|nr:hypothetical protein V495_05472 [Pseudogymnoascus sp. VKM F-4514 (FW-929)]KFY54146.1 hypothetical protein V497_07950 [Pseudogymnoascus sp. VKM F-4516 (FW-969)]
MTLHTTLLSALRALLRRTKRMHALLATFLRSLRPALSPSPTSLYAAEIESLFAALDAPGLRRLADGLQAEYVVALRENPACMLPSYSHVLPSGAETGRYVALDVGGSTFRVAVLELFGRDSEGGESIVRGSRTFRIDDVVKQRIGVAFFEWLAERIEETLGEVLGDLKDGEEREKMDMGLSWSFPIEHTSLRSGKIQGMGKGFRAMEGLLGADLADVLQGACDRRHLPVTLTATVNDAASTLLSRAYNTPHTHYGLILGTGTNIAVHLPTSLLGAKLAERSNNVVSPPTSPPSLSTSPGSSVSTSSAVPPHDHVIVNTEISMFGAGVLPLTRFDKALDAAHALPGFQPLEMLVSGRYLGEVARLVIVEGFERGALFADAKALPKGWERGYGLDTEVLAKLQVGEWKSLGLGITEADGEALGRIAIAVSARAARVVASSIYALRSVRDGAAAKAVTMPTKAELIEGVIEGTLTATPAAVKENTVVACAGAIIQFYPDFRAGTQAALDELCGEQDQGRIELCLAEESSLLGAAVGAAVVASGGEGR